MTKEHIMFMDTRADPGELLAGLEASINSFHGTTNFELQAEQLEADRDQVL